MSSLDEDKISEGFAWRVAGFFEEDRSPTVEVSAELDSEYETSEYLPDIGEALIELGVMLLRYDADELTQKPKSTKPRPSPKPKAETPKQDFRMVGGYL